jgi:hypothetical protein
MNEPILFASISAIVLLGSIQIAMATIHNYYLDCYKQGKFDALHEMKADNRKNNIFPLIRILYSLEVWKGHGLMDTYRTSYHAAYKLGCPSNSSSIDLSKYVATI